jgi:hypothetical protein
MKTGNWRIIQAETADHNPLIVRQRRNPGLLIATIILAIAVFALLALVVHMRMKMNKADSGDSKVKQGNDSTVNEMAETATAKANE